MRAADLVQRVLLPLDSTFRSASFSRRKLSRIFRRQTDEGVQEVAFDFDELPRYAPDAIAHLVPVIRISLPRVNEIARAMVNGNLMLLANAPETTLAEPLQIVAPPDVHERWFVRPQEVENLSQTIAHFIDRWLIPFMNEYVSARAFLDGVERGDRRLMLQQHTSIYVGAAYIDVGEPEKAKAFIEQRLGSAGLRKRFAPVFDFFSAASR